MKTLLKCRLVLQQQSYRFGYNDPKVKLINRLGIFVIFDKFGDAKLHRARYMEKYIKYWKYNALCNI